MVSLLKTPQLSYTRLKLLSRPVVVLPLITFVVFVIASVVASSLAQSTLDGTRQRAIERRAQEDALALNNSLSSYELIAGSAAAFVTTSGASQDSWDAFVDPFNIATRYPSINAVSYAQANPKDDGGTSLNVMYAYPNNPATQSRLGIDEYAYAARSDAIGAAVRNNRPTLTRLPESIRSSANPDAAPEPGFIMFAPIYDHSMPLDTPEQRQAALTGTANVSFRASKFFDAIYADDEQQTKTFLTVYQGADTSAPVVYSGGTHPARGDAVDYVQRDTYQDQTFTYAYQFSDSDLLTLIERGRPLTILIAGIMLGALLAILLLYGIRGRLHRVSMDKEREVQNAKDELLSLASHQLRTPATGVKQYMGMVLQGFAGDITPQQKEFLQKAYESNDRQLHVINDILHLAKLDAGRIVLSKTHFDLSELVRSVVEEQTASAVDGEVMLTRRAPKTLDVYADAHMMRMVIENLVSNGIKYTHPGGKVSVTVRSGKDDVQVAVRDTGVGIDTADLDKLFKQFSRVANDRSHLVSGTGVGLYLVKNLIELHGGSVTVTSTSGKGTTFTLVLPH